jgi:hypothetical protein
MQREARRRLRGEERQAARSDGRRFARFGRIDRRSGEPPCALRCRRTDARKINPLTASCAGDSQQTGPLLAMGKKSGRCRGLRGRWLSGRPKVLADHGRKSNGRRRIRTSDFRRVRVGHLAENRAPQALAKSAAQTARPQVHIAIAARIPKRVRYSVTGAEFRDNPTDTILRESNGRLPRWGAV